MVHRAKSQGTTFEAGGDLLVFKASRGDGAGSLFLELTCPPGGGPPPHTDPSEELCYVLDGEFEFYAPGAPTHRASPGDSVFVPARAPHSYRNVGDAPGRMLVFFRDNEHMQPFFEELGDPVDDAAHWTSSGPPPMQRALSAAQRHGIEPVF